MTKLLDGTVVGDIVLVSYFSLQVCRVLEIDHTKTHNVKVLSLRDNNTYNVWGSCVQKLTPEVYEKYKTEYLQKLQELEDGFKLIK